MDDLPQATPGRKFYPGLLFVQVELTERTFQVVTNTPKITGFLGGSKPLPIRDPTVPSGT